MARHKRRKVSTKMQNSKWIKSIIGINSQALIQEYILLYLALSTVQLTDHPDEIKWNWTMSGKYTIASAYECQFQGSFGTFLATHIWQAMTEPKCNFFVWLAMHDKILTASNMIKRNWRCNYNCALCLCMSENTEHLLIGCNFTEAAWNLVAENFDLPRYNVLSAS
jgi:hypothetical protein